MARKLVFDIDEFEKCESKLRNYAEELTTIQKNLQKAMDNLNSEKGWKSDGSDEFVNKYNTTWGEGIKDRQDVIIRMADHLKVAIEEYKTVVEKTDSLKLEI